MCEGHEQEPTAQDDLASKYCCHPVANGQTANHHVANHIAYSIGSHYKAICADIVTQNPVREQRHTNSEGRAPEEINETIHAYRPGQRAMLMHKAHRTANFRQDAAHATLYRFVWQRFPDIVSPQR